MRNLSILTTLGFVLSMSPAFAETMDETFGNTVTVTQPNGAVDRYFFEADGTFTERSHDGASYQGRWVRREGDVCLTVGDHQDCSPVPLDKAVGDTWAMTTSGGSLAITIVSGRG